MTAPFWFRLRAKWLVYLIPVMSATALANFSQQSITMGAGTYLNLDNGAGTRSSDRGGGVYDIQWVNNTFVPVDSARILNLGVEPAAKYQAITEADIRSSLASGGTSPIPASAIVGSDVFIAITNTGSASKVLVDRLVSGSIIVTVNTFTYIAPGTPMITQVLNNSSRIGPGLPNYGIAPSSLFVITGSSLADPGDPVLQSSADPGLPLKLNGASITVTVNGIVTNPPIYYTSPKQIAAVLPAKTPIGTGTLTVTYNGLTSAPAPIQVVSSALGINTYGFNTGVATDVFTGAVLSFTNSGAPGEQVVLWTTGLGADPADSDSVYSSPPHAVGTSLQIYIGGVLAKILYQGSAGYPGVNQINLVIPDSAPNGCWVSIVAVTGLVVSNAATLPINKGGGACVDATTGLTGSQYAPGGNATFRAGLVQLGVGHSTDSSGNPTTQELANADFSRYSEVSYDPPNSVSPGGCIIRQPVPVPILTGLDPGSIKLTGPNGLAVTLASTLGIKGAFNATLPAGSIPPTGGTYTYTGSGGADVGAFSTTLTFTNPLLTWTNPSAAANINSRAGFTVNWTGGNPGSFVYIGGASTARINNTTVVAEFTCVAYADDGTFTVPSSILLALPAGAGSVSVQNDIFVPLAASGLDIGTGQAAVGYTAAANFGSGVSR